MTCIEMDAPKSVTCDKLRPQDAKFSLFCTAREHHLRNTKGLKAEMKQVDCLGASLGEK